MAHTLFPPIEPFRTAFLKVSDLHSVHYEQCGNPSGIPVIFLHGGPGVGVQPKYRCFFDPKRYHIILLDQRGAGKSTPHAELRENTTDHIIADLEQLRTHLGIEKWLLFGGSWGSTLALLYAIAHPDSVTGLIMRGIFLGRQSEIDWLHKFGMSEIYPDAWERYCEPIPLAERNDMIGAYYRRLSDESLSPDQRLHLATAWSTWEGSANSFLPTTDSLNMFSDPGPALAIARIECHFTEHNFFLPSDNYILENASKIAHLPTWIVQGRYDVICPVSAAWQLHRALPNSELTIVSDGAHSPTDPGMADALIRATELFKRAQS